MNKEYLIYKLSDEVKNSCKIDKDAFTKFNVKRGLRNEDGSGVLVGLTNIGNVVGYERDENGKLKPSLPAGEREPHAGEGRGLAAEGFAVDEVAPAADALPDE